LAQAGAFADRIPIAALLRSGRGLAAGALRRDARGQWLLRDGSGEIAVPEAAVSDLDGTRTHWAALRFEGWDRAARLAAQPIAPSPEVARLQAGFERQRGRMAIHQAIRGFFRDRGFLEVDTPVRVPCPGMEPYLDSFAAQGLYLRTSPELHMKRLLAAGFDPIFQIAPCFRAGERGSRHREEFLMLEWYRAFADLETLIDDVAALLHALAPLAANPDYFRRSPEVVTVQALFAERLDLHLRDCEDRAPLRSCLEAKKLGWDEDDDWDTLFFKLFLNCIEPRLGFERPLILRNYPASQAALARLGQVGSDEMPYCLRFELYVRGVELANAFDELTDPAEQRARFEADRALRQKLGKPVYPIDEAFMAALESGLPPSAGIALGVDRLAMVLLGASSLDEILPFPPEG